MKSSSAKNFAVNLVRELFTWDELKGRNVLGVQSKQAVVPVRMKLVRDYYFKMFPAHKAEEDLQWGKCHRAIDENLRCPVKRTLHM